jgi:hypothetical protein
MPTDGTHRDVHAPAFSVTTSEDMASSSLTQPLAVQQRSIRNLPDSVDMRMSRIGETTA